MYLSHAPEKSAGIEIPVNGLLSCRSALLIGPAASRAALVEYQASIGGLELPKALEVVGSYADASLEQVDPTLYSSLHLLS